jgi:hypothetical protein
MIMATLQSSRQVSAYTAKARLKQVTGREHPPTANADPVKPVPISGPVEEAIEFVSAAFPPAPERLRLEGKPHGLSERDLQSLLLQTVTLYQNWRLVSVLHKPESDLIVAHLLRTGDRIDPAVAIREGRTMQVIMDATGNMKVQYARRRVTSWKHWLYRLTAIFARTL